MKLVFDNPLFATGKYIFADPSKFVTTTITKGSGSSRELEQLRHEDEEILSIVMAFIHSVIR